MEIYHISYIICSGGRQLGADGRRIPNHRWVSLPRSLSCLLATYIYIYGITGYRNYILTDRSSSPEKSWRGRARRSLEVLSHQREKTKQIISPKTKKGNKLTRKKYYLTKKCITRLHMCLLFESKPILQQEGFSKQVKLPVCLNWLQNKMPHNNGDTLQLNFKRLDKNCN